MENKKNKLILRTISKAERNFKEIVKVKKK